MKPVPLFLLVALFASGCESEHIGPVDSLALSIDGLGRYDSGPYTNASGDIVIPIDVPDTPYHIDMWARLYGAPGTSGDANLCLSYGAPPFPWAGDEDYCNDGVTYSGWPGNDELVTVDRPRPGTWYIAIHTHTPFTGVMLNAGVSSGADWLPDAAVPTYEIPEPISWNPGPPRPIGTFPLP
jgi:hypothetical protein